MDIQDIKNRFSIIGNSPLLHRAIDVARQVAPTDITVLITGESGSGKEVFSQIIHQLSARKHGPFIAVNCGAIPEGTIDSELFGHEKGSFTGAHEARKGYFEVVDGGTIFLDEVGELPLGTQARLLRVLESGEYIRVGSSKVQKTDVRVVAATNVDMYEAVQKGKFREDLYYRLNTVPLRIPPLRERKEDIHLLFRKFVADFTDKYRSPSIQLTADAQQLLTNYSWPGNVRQLKNIAEQLAVLERERTVDAATLSNYIPREAHNHLPVHVPSASQNKDDFSERDLLYKVLFEMKRDMVELKKLVVQLIQNGANRNVLSENSPYINQLYKEVDGYTGDSSIPTAPPHALTIHQPTSTGRSDEFEIQPQEAEEVEESLSLVEKESDLIRKALKKHKGKRKSAAQELGISERTLYRKIKDLNLIGIIWITFLFLSLQGCGIKYSFTGGSIPQDMNTVTVHIFENQAPIVYPTLSETLTEGLKTRIRTRSRLSQVANDGDGIFEGSITYYTIGPAAVEAGTDRAALTRLTITVNVKYTNSINPEDDFTQSFSRYKDFSTAVQPLQAQEEQIIKDIVDMLTEDIYNRAFANW